MKTYSFFVLFIVFIFFISSSKSHSKKHVRFLCATKAVKHIRKVCPDMCLTGEEVEVNEFCKMGYSDSQIKYICCPE
ncbi:putative insulin-like peptide alpha-type 1 [Caenorhabditis elegans]|uniref:Probable insulin-like peptide alpha-type 1 n=1 Tax=Caenorhabditis elegans TaxID=6239 RepID=ILA1_CAEEL|nr:putative insulin-like peptide alpha-type 1 [Caenorhabditis elegans]Q21507.2 RecName: Full=Probable insulin-like peptide alpha-type 1; Flags: Precursor [Caenorhabditis elegans]CAA83610.2 Probable insulin-like peptide alpha-type 1 [Caenorhabditis elegans]|eukprot:NP_499222.2 Probable insulin-like peptide alpha-type 1 [Caenorhabditis elegans]